jgi:hypothetical protein
MISHLAARLRAAFEASRSRLWQRYAICEMAAFLPPFATARSMADIIPFDKSSRHGRFHVPRWTAAILRALHESRQRQGVREIVSVLGRLRLFLLDLIAGGQAAARVGEQLATFQGRSSAIRLIRWSAMRPSTSRK